MNKMFLLAAGSAAVLAVSQTSCTSVPINTCAPAEVKAVYTNTDPTKDLNSPAWKAAQSYKLVHAKHAFDRQPCSVVKAFSKGPVDAGDFCILQDGKNLYVRFYFSDQDLVTEGDKDQIPLEGKGDFATVYLKNEGSSAYWQFTVSPLNKKSVFFCPGRGRQGLASCMQEKVPVEGFRSIVKFKGTIGNPMDKDICWGGVMVIPLSKLPAPKGGKNCGWKILVGRGNFSRYLLLKEMTSYPGLEYNNFASYEEYATLKLEK